MTGLACLACGRTDPCPDCRHHNQIPGWDEPTLPLEVTWDREYPVGLRLDAPLGRLVEVIKKGAVDGS